MVWVVGFTLGLVIRLRLEDWNCWAKRLISLSDVSVSDWWEIISKVGCWFNTIRPFSVEGEAAFSLEGEANLVNICSMILTVELY